MSDKSAFVPLLQDAVQRLHKCEAIHMKTVSVLESFQGRTIWEGNVEVFEVKGHPRAARCFAWLLQEDGDCPRCVALLDTWPVTSPGTAVRTAIAMDITMRPEGNHWTNLNLNAE
jgi:hypothetical protein